ncbi:MAG: 6-bladed beta-propeller [Bacteroidales bacterium]
MKNKHLLLLIITILLISCSRNTTGVISSDNLIIYPSPPDTARIQFLTKISSSRDVTGFRNSFAKFIFGENENILINKPYGVAVYNGKIMLCDTYIHGLVIIDMKNNKFEQFVPKGKGELKVPINCFIDNKGYLYIADSERKQIVIFDENREYMGCFGDLENFKPVDVFVLDNKIWVTNLASHKINVYSNESNYKLLNTFPNVTDSAAGVLFSPTNIFVTNNKVYVTDFGDFKIKIYTHEGKYLSSVGSYGKGIGQLARPKGIAVDRDSNLYVVDAGFENTQIFSKDGKLLMFFGGSYKSQGDMWLPAKVSLDYDNLDYFQKFVDRDYKLKYLVLVTNQFGPDKLNIYGAIEPLKASEKSFKKEKKKKVKKQSPMFN